METDINKWNFELSLTCSRGKTRDGRQWRRISGPPLPPPPSKLPRPPWVCGRTPRRWPPHSSDRSGNSPSANDENGGYFEEFLLVGSKEMYEGK